VGCLIQYGTPLLHKVRIGQQTQFLTIDHNDTYDWSGHSGVVSNHKLRSS